MKSFPQQRKIDFKLYSKYMAGATLVVALSNPIELIKSRLQTSNEHVARKSVNKPYIQVFETTNRIVKHQGVGGLFKGVGHYLMRTIPATVGVFSLKEIIHKNLTRYTRQGNQESTFREFVQSHYMVINGLIGGFAGFVIQLIIYPFQYFRTIISNEVSNKSGTGIQKCIRDTIKHRGILGIFSGATMNIIYMSSARAVYFGLFDSFKHNISNQYFKYLLSYLSISCALLVNYPLDTIRKRVVLGAPRYESGRACFKYMLKNESFGDFYNGWRVIFFQGITLSLLLSLYDRMFTQIFKQSQQ